MDLLLGYSGSTAGFLLLRYFSDTVYPRVSRCHSTLSIYLSTHMRRMFLNIGGGQGLEYWGSQGGQIPSRHMTS